MYQQSAVLHHLYIKMHAQLHVAAVLVVKHEGTPKSRWEIDRKMLRYLWVRRDFAQGIDK